MGKMKETKNRQEFRDKVNDIDKMYSLKKITLAEKIQMKKELMGLGQ